MVEVCVVLLNVMLLAVKSNASVLTVVKSSNIAIEIMINTMLVIIFFIFII